MTPLKVVVLPRDRNPYQELLYGPLRSAGVAVCYAAALTRSHTLNLLLLPVELLARRLAGYRVLHLHWVFGFTFPGSRRSRMTARIQRAVVRRAARLRSGAWLRGGVDRAQRAAAQSRLRRRPPGPAVVGDALRPRHRPQCPCDRRPAEIGAAPARTCVMPIGPMAAPEDYADLPEPGRRPLRSVLFFGRVEDYKGVDQLLEAVEAIDSELEVVVAGECQDPVYRRRLEDQAGRSGSPSSSCSNTSPTRG